MLVLYFTSDCGSSVGRWWEIMLECPSFIVFRQIVNIPKSFLGIAPPLSLHSQPHQHFYTHTNVKIKNIFTSNFNPQPHGRGHFPSFSRILSIITIHRPHHPPTGPPHYNNGAEWSSLIIRYWWSGVVVWSGRERWTMERVSRIQSTHHLDYC